jgi:hypothetical protein
MSSSMPRSATLEKTANYALSLPNEYGNMSRLFNPNGGNKIVNCIWIMLHITYHT